jgi:hypothetical protein
MIVFIVVCSACLPMRCRCLLSLLVLYVCSQCIRQRFLLSATTFPLAPIVLACELRLPQKLVQPRRFLLMNGLSARMMTMALQHKCLHTSRSLSHIVNYSAGELLHGIPRYARWHPHNVTWYTHNLSYDTIYTLWSRVRSSSAVAQTHVT